MSFDPVSIERERALNQAIQAAKKRRELEAQLEQERTRATAAESALAQAQARNGALEKERDKLANVLAQAEEAASSSDVVGAIRYNWKAFQDQAQLLERYRTGLAALEQWCAKLERFIEHVSALCATAVNGNTINAVSLNAECAAALTPDAGTGAAEGEAKP